MNYKDILNTKIVVEEYGKIDNINPYPFNHGLKHVGNVCMIMEELCDVLKIEDDKKSALLISCALHDIGQADGRESHGKKAKEFTVNNFSNILSDNLYWDDILKAIEEHDELCSASKSLFSILVQFCDKMDISKKILEDNYREKFRYYCYEDIIKVAFIYDDDVFGINIITNEVKDFNDKFLSENFPKKVINAVLVLAEKLNRKAVILVNGAVLQY